MRGNMRGRRERRRVARVVSSGLLVPALALLAVLAAGCGGGDDGADVREVESGSGSASGSGSGSGSASGSSSGSAPAGVPAGVAAQYTQLAEEIAAEGGETESGPWRIGYIVEPAEPWYVPEGGDYRFREPAAGETHHIEIIPFEAATGRVVPEVPIRLEIVDGNGQVVDAKALNFYYAEFFHYANNFSVPEAGSYTLRATLEAPPFLRHGAQGADPALTEGAEVEFPNVQLDPA